MTKLGTALLLLVVTSCGGETESDGAGGAGTTLPSNQTLVVRRVFMGETDRELTPDPDAWKKYGRDLDGLVSNGSEAKHCKTQPGPSAAAIRTDGPGGIDNAWGAHLMPLLTLQGQYALTEDANGAIDAGDGTLLLRLEVEPASDLYTGAAFESAPFAGVPTWNGEDAWFVTFDSVLGGDLKAPFAPFPDAKLVKGELSLGPKTTLLLSIGGPSTLLLRRLIVRQARIFAQLTGTGAAARATGGVIVGVIATEDLLDELRTVAGALDPSLCSGSTIESIEQQIRDVSDIMLDGTNGDPNQSCDGISFGIGFEAVAGTLAGVAAPLPPLVDPCQ